MLKEIDLANEIGLTTGQRRFLISYSENWDVAEACGEISDFSVAMHYSSLEDNKTYKKWWDIVQRMIENKAEDEAVRRAIKGVQQPKFAKNGEITRVETVYSDQLLKSYLGARVPGYSTVYQPKGKGKGGKGEEEEKSRVTIMALPNNGRGAEETPKEVSPDGT